jgi:hypothetical protein
VEGNETVILTVSADAAYTVGSPNSATVSIADNDQAALPTVTVAASDANASETGPDTGRFTVSRSGATTAGLTVRYSLGGTAANGSDYASLSGTLTIPDGAASATITVTPIDDSAVEGNETVILTVSADAAYTVGSPNSATVSIADNDQAPTTPTVTVVASDPSAAEHGSDPGTFTISRSGGTTTALTVNYSVGGSAVNGTDYQSLSGSVTIPTASASVIVSVRPIDDKVFEGSETVILTLSSNPSYTVGSPNSATVTIADNDQAPTEPPVVTLIAPDILASEPGTDTATLTVSHTGSQAASLTVRYTLVGTAINGVDYQTLSGSVTIPAGAASANIVLRPINDSLIELAELVTVTLTPDAAYILGAPAIAVITIADDDLLILGNESDAP